jgi:hypothetical protein
MFIFTGPKYRNKSYVEYTGTVITHIVKSRLPRCWCVLLSTNQRRIGLQSNKPALNLPTRPVNGEARAQCCPDQSKAGLSLKNPPKKTHPETHPKKPTKKGFLGFF